VRLLFSRGDGFLFGDDLLHQLLELRLARRDLLANSGVDVTTGSNRGPSRCLRLLEGSVGVDGAHLHGAHQSRA
jgi:hypothetical protein